MQILYFIPIHILLTYLSHSQGQNFYNNRIKKQKTTPKVYDIGIKYTPNLQNNKLLQLLSNFTVLILPFLFGKTITYEYIKYFIIIMLIRYIFTNLTILPKSPDCDDTKLDISNFILGHCYDKIFSGHYSSFLLLTLILKNHGIITGPIAILLNIFNAWVIISLRYHYTVDIAVSILVVLLVYKN